MNGLTDTPGIKVGHVRASNFFGGPEKQIVQHLLSMRRSGFEHLLCSFREGGRETELVVRARELGLTCVSIPCAHAYDPRQVTRLRKLFTEQRPHIVCSHDYRSNLLVRLGVRGLGIAQIAFWRGVTRENLKVTLFHRMERHLLKAASHVVVVSREQHDALVAGGLSEESVSVVPNAVNAGQAGGRVPAFFERFSGRRVVATAGRLSPEKGHRYLIEAFSRVLKDRPDAFLLVFGEGPARERLTDLVQKLGCSGSVHLAGFTPDFVSLLAGIDVFVLPSLSEGLPNALLEAMAAATPVVATTVGGVPELVADGVSGLLVSPGDSEALAGAILRLLSDAESARCLGLAGQEAVREAYSFERQCQLLMKVYETAASR